MSGPGHGGPPDADVIGLTGLLGAGPGELRERLGPPAADRRVDGQRWLVWELDGMGSLRVRCSPVVSSWSLSFRDPLPPSFRGAASRVGLWPELAPEAGASERAAGLVRRRVRDREGRAASATAALGPGGVVRLAVFDEPPEW